MRGGGLLKSLFRSFSGKASASAAGRLQQVLARFPEPYRLHLGCGRDRKPGWINIDLNAERTPDFLWDVAHGLPFDDASCEFIFHEHLLEHFDPAHARRLLGECRRVLKPGGVLRIAMPDLQSIVGHFREGTWREQDWVKELRGEEIRTAAEMLNMAMRYWGHVWLYDWEELARRLQETGFTEVRQASPGASVVPELRGLETRADSLLVGEAV
jgi:predicted SAM-dependent methyltransferase